MTMKAILVPLLFLIVASFVAHEVTTANDAIEAETGAIARDLKRFPLMEDEGIDCAVASRQAAHGVQEAETQIGIIAIATRADDAIAQGCSADAFPTVADLQAAFDARQITRRWSQQLILGENQDINETRMRQGIAEGRKQAMERTPVTAQQQPSS